jgi:anthranilate synthase component 1
MFPFVSRLQYRDQSLSLLAEHLCADGPCALWEPSQRRLEMDGSSTHQAGRYAYLAVNPRTVVMLRDFVLQITRRNQAVSTRRLEPGEDPFDALNAEFPFLSRPQPRSTVPVDLARLLPPFAGGILGVVAYDTGRYFERISGSSAPADEPELLFFEAAELIVLDRDEHALSAITWAECETDATAATEHEQLIQRLQTVIATHPDSSPEQASRSGSDLNLSEMFSRDEFAARVRRAKEYIRAGDIFQVVLANRFFTSDRLRVFAAYEQLRKLNPSPYHFLFRFAEHTLIGASPEVMLQGEQQENESLQVRMRLVAGTYPRREADAAGAVQTEQLSADDKERAEHLMLVDHARNDIGRVSLTGSVQPSDLFSVETYRDVHHLVSQVRGTLRPGETVLSALRSCFPIATLTGTPKIRAMEIIAELETPARGIFGGAVLALDWNGSLDSAVAIRAILAGPSGCSVQAGAGIVQDSDPFREYEECRWKAQALLAVIAGCRE